MKKLFPIAFFSAALMFVACGDDSSSGPEEESSSSIEAEDESSSSVEEGKSSAADKKSSSSEAKKGDSSSSEKVASSSSETVSSSSEAVSSSSEISYEPTCVVKTEGSVASVETHFYATDMGGDVEQVMELDYEKYELLTTVDFAIFASWGFESCEDVNKLPMVQSGAMIVKNCSDENKTIDQIVPYDPDDFEQNFGTIANAKEAICGSFLSEFIVDTTALNQKMLEDGKYGTFRDTRDAMLYRTIKIGNQTWMAQNLNYVSQYDGASWCYDDAESCAKYGRLYTWAAAMDKPEGSCGNGHVCGMTGTVQGICPDGWHLPSKEELHELLNFASTEVDSTTNLGESVYDVAGTKLQTSGTNEYGFSALLTGYYDDEYCEVKNMTYFWSSSEKNADEVYMFYVGSDFESAVLKSEGKDFGQSVRCIKD